MKRNICYFFNGVSLTTQKLPLGFPIAKDQSKFETGNWHCWMGFFSNGRNHWWDDDTTLPVSKRKESRHSLQISTTLLQLDAPLNTTLLIQVIQARCWFGC